MANSMVQFEGIRRESQRFALNNREIPGIQDIQISYEQSAGPLTHLGINTQPQMILNGFQVGKVSLSTLLVTQDFFIPFTGISGFDGVILTYRSPNTDGRVEPQQMPETMGFISGYLTNYKSSCAIGDFPIIDVDIEVFNDIGLLNKLDHPIAANHWFITRYNDPLDYKYKIADYTSIEILLDDLKFSKILSYDISIATPRRPFYIPGFRNPITVESIKPIEVRCSFSIEPDNWWLEADATNYKPTFLKSFPTNEVKKNVTITLNDNETNVPIATYSFPNMTLIGENYVSNVNNNVAVQVGFVAYYM